MATTITVVRSKRRFLRWYGSVLSVYPTLYGQHEIETTFHALTKLGAYIWCYFYRCQHYWWWRREDFN